MIAEALELFKADKLSQGLTPDVLGIYTRELERLQSKCRSSGRFSALP